MPLRLGAVNYLHRHPAALQHHPRPVLVGLGHACRRRWRQQQRAAVGKTNGQGFGGRGCNEGADVGAVLVGADRDLKWRRMPSKYDQQHDQGGQPKPATEFPQLFVHGLDGERKTKDHGRPVGDGQTHSVVQEVTIDGDTVANGLAVAACKGGPDFRASGVIFHGLRIGLRIRQHLATLRDHGHARAARGHLRNPAAKAGGGVLQLS